MATTLNMFDLVFIIIGLIFVILAFFRGFVKEIFSLFNWIISLTIAYLLSPFLAKFIASYSHNKVVATIISSIFLFIASFICSVLLTRELSTTLKEKIPEGLDKFLGVGYGFFKVFLVFGIIHSLTINVYMLILGDFSKGKSYIEIVPAWLYQAKVRPYIEPFGKAVDPLITKIIFGTVSEIAGKTVKINKEEIKKAKDKVEEKIEERDDQVEEIIEERYGKKKFGRKGKEIGYSKKEIEKMDRLIEIVE
ncbi:MAG TPA: CvpA family protein [Rickettsiales bacterium]|nr:CvpA family protein [Rickettsiales bacterium]